MTGMFGGGCAVAGGSLGFGGAGGGMGAPSAGSSSGGQSGTTASIGSSIGFGQLGAANLSSNFSSGFLASTLTTSDLFIPSTPDQVEAVHGNSMGGDRSRR